MQQVRSAGGSCSPPTACYGTDQRRRLRREPRARRSAGLIGKGSAIDTPEISVVLPTYNEAGHIVDLLGKIGSALRSASLSFEIIVVDDDSPDGTADLVTRHFNGDARIRMQRRLRDRGLGPSIGEGIALCSGRMVAVLDADFNHDPVLIPAMVDMLGTADLVIGSRYVRGGSMPDRRRYWASYAFNLLVRALVRTGVHDNLSGYFVAPCAWLQSVDPATVFHGYGDYFMRLIALAHWEQLRIRELPVRYGLRPSGESKTSFIRTPGRYLAAAIRLATGRDRPRLRTPVSAAAAR